MRVSRQVGSAVLVLGLLAAGGCAPGPAGAAAPTSSVRGTLAPGAGAAAADPVPSPAPRLCAELPPSSAPGEGWWNGAPADAEGAVLRDPADWPDARLRDHPRVALVEVDSGAVLSAWDRVACADAIPGYSPPVPTPGGEAGTVVVLDADTGELLETLRGPLTTP
jgi:hypothetical protein